MARPWLPSSEYWKSIDAKSGNARPPDKGSSDEEKADNHIADAKKATMVGLHNVAAAHMARASSLTKIPAKQETINSTAKKMANQAMQSGHGAAWNLSNVTQLAGPAPYHRDADETVQCPACKKYNDTDARYCDQCGVKLPDSAFETSNTGRRAVQLAGPKGYEHGWRYVGGAGLPSSMPVRASHVKGAGHRPGHPQLELDKYPRQQAGKIDLGGHKPESAEGRRRAFAAGHALEPASKGGSPGFPITDAAHWEKAREAVGRVKDPSRRAALAKLLQKTAPEFGKTAALKKSWAAPAAA
ncbi:MAG TPA: zinc ribbon domain-containing protein [Streptosporangiaceae bacterium]|jgi:hypothetical protein